jgi:Zn-dependent peptidase ImmA (M78 family)
MENQLGWINDHTSYQYEIDSLPEIKFSSTEEIAMVAFGKDLPKALDLIANIKGLYNYKEGTVYLLNSIDIDSEKGRAVLLHELVHYLQYEHDQEKEAQCKNELEALAYVLEAKYLEEQDMKVGFSVNHVQRVSQCS